MKLNFNVQLFLVESFSKRVVLLCKNGHRSLLMLKNTEIVMIDLGKSIYFYIKLEARLFRHCINEETYMKLL